MQKMLRKVVVRVLVFEGTPAWVDETLQRCAVAPGAAYRCALGTVTELPRASAMHYESPLTTIEQSTGFGEGRV